MYCSQLYNVMVSGLHTPTMLTTILCPMLGFPDNSTAKLLRIPIFRQSE